MAREGIHPETPTVPFTTGWDLIGTVDRLEFQKFEDYRGLIANCPLGALARLQLGRAYAMAGDTTKAKAAYQDFVTLWEDADPDIPILKQAKAEYARLQ